ncbi:MAG: hypothetical protein DRQ39_11330 [Gammaproteobacteria bacterium]|nr:MAG: hypothetical protein DRQ39_11330 [Gammaproteobacteria bacterium]
MATEHSSLLWLPDAMRGAGLNVIELDGWKVNEQGYYWTHPDMADPYNLDADTHDGYAGDPNGWTWHHTATSGYTPYVKNSRGQTKACLWMGLWYDGRLYHEHASGVPTVVVASSGPADYSQGSGVRDLLVDYLVKDRRYDGPQRLSDTSPTYYANRYTGATEIVHPGYGEPLHEGVWEASVVTGALLSAHYDWRAWRNHGHYDHTRRKVDPRFEKGYPYSIAPMQDEMATLLDAPVVPPIEPPDPGDDVDYRTVKNVPDANWARNVVDRMLCLAIIAEGDGSDWEKPLKNGTIWNYLYRYTDAIQRDKIDNC